MIDVRLSVDSLVTRRPARAIDLDPATRLSVNPDAIVPRRGYAGAALDTMSGLAFRTDAARSFIHNSATHVPIPLVGPEDAAVSTTKERS
jgi:hypothetical protein